MFEGVGESLKLVSDRVQPVFHNGLHEQGVAVILGVAMGILVCAIDGV